MTSNFTTALLTLHSPHCKAIAFGATLYHNLLDVRVPRREDKGQSTTTAKKRTVMGKIVVIPIFYIDLAGIYLLDAKTCYLSLPFELGVSSASLTSTLISILGSQSGVTFGATVWIERRMVTVTAWQNH